MSKLRKALIVGIDHYADEGAQLYGAGNDARSVFSLLDRNEDNSKNFDARLLVSEPDNLVGKALLKEQVKELFDGKGETCLLYYAGHGHTEDTGGYLCPSDCPSGEDGLALQDIMTWADKSEFENRVIILDSCHSGAAGSRPNQRATSEISEGVTILTASTDKQYAKEGEGGGVFTNLLVDALSGAASNLVGEITPGAIYSHVDQSLGTWGQRPMFKTNVQNFVCLRRVHPPVSPHYLRRIPDFFPSPGYYFQLDPSFEPERGPPQLPSGEIPPPDAVNTVTFAILQDLARVGLVQPEGQPHMWHAAMYNGGAKLTRLGEHYRQLVIDNLL
jgi:Caspase domain